jgi:hypothetical protein
VVGRTDVGATVVGFGILLGLRDGSAAVGFQVLGCLVGRAWATLEVGREFS